MTDQNAYNRRLIEEFRAHRGKTGGPMEGRPLLLITTTGAKSGQLRTTPIMYIPDGENLLVIASNAGAPTHPDWYRNLLAQPEVTVEVRNETFKAIASVAEGVERQRLWSRIVELYPFFADHQAKITRQIPVIVLVLWQCRPPPGQAQGPLSLHLIPSCVLIANIFPYSYVSLAIPICQLERNLVSLLLVV